MPRARRDRAPSRWPPAGLADFGGGIGLGLGGQWDIGVARQLRVLGLTDPGHQQQVVAHRVARRQLAQAQGTLGKHIGARQQQTRQIGSRVEGISSGVRKRVLAVRVMSQDCPGDG